MRAVERASAHDTSIARVCHQAMHRLAARVPPLTEAQVEVATRLRGACASGFVHGVFERSLERDSGDAVARAVQVCSALWRAPAADHLAARECFHGLGHGLRRRARSLDRALDRCEFAVTARQARSKCFGGAYMEEMFRSLRSGGANERTSPCSDSMPGARAGACYAFSFPFTGDVDSAVSWCEGASRDAVRSLCFASFGRSLPRESAGQCGELQYVLAVDACFSGLVRGHVHEARAMTITQVRALCRSIPAPFDERCTAAAGSLYRPGTTRPRVDSMSEDIV